MGQSGSLVVWPSSRGLDYQAAVERMTSYTLGRIEQSDDALWPVEHPAVFSLGLAAQKHHLLNTESIAIVQADRGGQVTYHGPGQLVIYCLLNLRRYQLTVRSLVTLLESALIAFIEGLGVKPAYRVIGAPGVYVNCQCERHKIAALGLKIKNGCSYHGVALNLQMDLEPFERINPCGVRGLKVTDLSKMGVPMPWDEAAQRVCQIITEMLLSRRPHDH
jgi:lipoyl(octanoyl) transferase